MFLRISCQHQCQRSITGYIAGCSKAVLQCKIVSISAVPVSSNPSTPVINPRDAITVPPGTPGAPIANTPSSTQNNSIIPNDGIFPYKILTLSSQRKLLSEPSHTGGYWQTAEPRNLPCHHEVILIFCTAKRHCERRCRRHCSNRRNICRSIVFTTVHGFSPE